MTLIGVNHQLGGDVLGAQRMPEFKGLGGRALTVPVAKVTGDSFFPYP